MIGKRFNNYRSLRIEPPRQACQHNVTLFFFFELNAVILDDGETEIETGIWFGIFFDLSVSNDFGFQFYYHSYCANLDFGVCVVMMGLFWFFY